MSERREFYQFWGNGKTIEKRIEPKERKSDG